jgi:hypothetical protein
MTGRRFGVAIPTAEIVAGLRDLARELHTDPGFAFVANCLAPPIPDPLPLSIPSEGADGLAGILFGQGSQSGWGFAQLCGWHCIHARDSRGQGIDGLPDWICMRECVIYVELKRQRDELRPAQVDMAARLIAAGAHYLLIRPSDWREICEVLIHGPRGE